MRRMRSHRLTKVTVLVAVAVAVALAVPALASASTYCVGSPSECSGIAKPGTAAGLQEALSQAEANAESDSIRIGPGTYTAPGPAGFSISSPAHGVHIRGEGPAATVLAGSGLNAVTLRLSGVGGDASTVSDLGLKLSEGGGSPSGLVLTHGGAGNVAVTSSPGLTDGHGVELIDASFEHGSVTVPGLHGIETANSSFVGNASILARVALKSSVGTLFVAKSRIETSQVGIATGSGAAGITDTLIHVRGGVGDESGLLATSNVQAEQLTVVGTGTPKHGLVASRAGGGSALVKLQNSTVSGFVHDLAAMGDGISLAGVAVSYSNYATATALPGGTVTPGFGNLNVPPGFVDAGAGDFHLRHDSPLLDMGDDIIPPGSTDLDDRPRVVDSDGSGGPRADIGAYEYQRAAPAAEISGPAFGTAGAPLELSGAGSSDPDPGDALTYAWTFGDGGAANGENASHTYAAPGTYTVFLRVTDPTGHEATTTRDVVIGPAPAPGELPAGGPGAPSVPGADTLAPAVSGLTLTPRRFRLGSRLPRLTASARTGATIRFSLSEPATVTLRFFRLVPGRGYVRLRPSIGLRGRQGANVVRFEGRLSRRRALRPGRYRVTVFARDAAGRQARSRAAPFVLLRRAS
jgi:PKD domain